MHLLNLEENFFSYLLGRDFEVSGERSGSGVAVAAERTAEQER